MSKKVVSDVVRSFVDVIVQSVASGERVSLVGFGTWVGKVFKARKGRNPQNGAIIEIPQKLVPKFIAGKSFKEEVNR